MILGLIGQALVKSVRDQILQRMKGMRSLFILDHPHLLVGFEYSYSSQKSNNLWVSDDQEQGILWDGEIYNWDTLKKITSQKNRGESLWALYQKEGASFLNYLNGDFSLVTWDFPQNQFLLARDKIGVRDLFYGFERDGLAFGNGLRLLASALEKTLNLESSAMMKYLTFCYNPGTQTLFTDLQRLRPGHSLLWKDNKELVQRYWNLSFQNPYDEPEEHIGERIREELTLAVNRRSISKNRKGAFLSGGLDSSSIVSLLHQSGIKDLSTYSFRCKGESFDESPYAQIVADTYATNHHLIDYNPESILLAEEMVDHMDEPFCDIGINIGTYLLAKNAAHDVKDLFTGDGGDELFAGHPVYVADKSAHLISWIPKPLLFPLFFFGRHLADSEKKKDWRVKVKRFSESYQYPKTLLTHRWRVYYRPHDLKQLVAPCWQSGEDLNGIYKDIKTINHEINVPDTLSRSLASDYQSVVQFYLRRMDLARSLGLHPKMPMLDPDLISYCARIPSNLKIRGMSDTKYIERVAVDPLLPNEIVHRKDKLGHSIPLKNWMRDNKIVKDFILDLLSEETIKRRGLFHPEKVQQMIKAHMNWSHNHSHRLWAMAILELWLRSRENQLSL